MRPFSLPPEAVARPIANALPKMMPTATTPTSAATTHLGTTHPPRLGGVPDGAAPSSGGGGGVGCVISAGCVGWAASSSAPLVMAGIVADQLGSALSKD